MKSKQKKIYPNVTIKFSRETDGRVIAEATTENRRTAVYGRTLRSAALKVCKALFA